MKRFLLAVLLCTAFPCLADTDPVFDRVMNAIQTRSAKPTRLAWSPSGRYIAYLQWSGTDEANELWAMDTGTMQARRIAGAADTGTETAAEKALKERMRIGGDGITWFSWTADNRLLYKSDGLQLSSPDGASRSVLPISIRPILFPLVSPDGQRIAFVSDGNVFVFDRQTGASVQITDGAGADITFGMAEYAAAEELGRYTGMWWGPDSGTLYFTRVDNSSLPTIALLEDSSLEHQYSLQRYPIVGAPLADVTLFSWSTGGDTVTPVPLPGTGERYLARLCHMGNDPAVIILSRDQKTLQLYSLGDPAHPELIFMETDDSWINLHDTFHWFPESRSFLWQTASSGNTRLVRCTPGKGEPVPVTTDGEVRDLVGVTGNQVLYTGNGTSPNNTCLYALDLDTGAIEILEEGGILETTLSPDGTRYLVSSSFLENPGSLELVDRNTGQRKVLFNDSVQAIDGLPPMKRERITIPLADGTVLYGILDKPRQLDPEKQYPLLLYTYGGPGSQIAADRWRARTALWHQYLVSKGICVFQMDNRGTGHRGRMFERLVHKDLGHLELKDQIVGVDHVCRTHPWLDRSRTAIWGWSYGGYMAAMGMTRFAGSFKVGVAVAPVTDWRLYDAPYTERYMETPETNPAGYRDSSVLTWADRLTGKLLLVHGISDDNVHVQHTEVLLNALVEAGKHPDLMLYPAKKHSIRGNRTQHHLFQKITRYLLTHL